MTNDTVSIDGPMAVAWASDLDLTVERFAMSVEGLVNIYRGTGKILMAPPHRPAEGEGPAEIGQLAEEILKT